MGQITGNHKSNHSYRVIETNSIPIFDPDWGADEEMWLIEGLEMHGLGNWPDVAEYIGTGRTKEECERHYLKIYISSPQYPLPDLNKKIDFNLDHFRARKRRRIEEKSKFACSIIPSAIKKGTLSSVPANHEVQGYMPGRLEFETEIENEAEIVVKDMSFEDDVDEKNEGDNELKLAVLDVYNSRLTKRSEYKRIIFEHNLLDFKHLQSSERKRSKEERDLLQKCKVFARLQSGADFNVFVEGLLKELLLRKRIKELQEWRKNGLTGFSQGAKYERDKAQRLSFKQISNSPLSDKYNVKPTGKFCSSIVLKHSQNEINQVLAGTAESYLLSIAEQSICNTLHILPKPYMAVKEIFIRQFLSSDGILRKNFFKDKLKIDFNKLSKLFDFFVQSGWINT